MLDFKYRINQRLCIGCEKCAEVCPTLAIDFNAKKRKAFVLDIDQCLVCHQCIEVCPVEAITLKGGLWQDDIRIPEDKKGAQRVKGGYINE
jgi:formate hydrogenlyase subunit 6/NADH:ubiquinone oxidoreductase subunit I